MKRQLFGVLGVFILLGWLGGVSFAATTRVSVNIPFSFMADGKSYPAGSYEILEESSQLRIRSVNSTAQGNYLNYYTRTFQLPGSETMVVFDKVGDQAYLAEIHIAGQDGFHLQGAPGPHSHVMIKASR